MRRQRGFTLIELVITMVVITILGAIAIPGYTGYLKKSARQEARQLLLQAAVRQETQRIRSGSYATAMTALGYDDGIVFTGSGRYRVAVGTGTPTRFTLTATPTGKGGQDSDPCGTLTINHLGERGITTTASPAPTVASCWQ